MPRVGKTMDRKAALRRTSAGNHCGIPAMTLPPCDLEWGHDGDMHSNEGDGFYADQHPHRRRHQRPRRCEVSESGMCACGRPKRTPADLERWCSEVPSAASYGRSPSTWQLVMLGVCMAPTGSSHNDSVYPRWALGVCWSLTKSCMMANKTPLTENAP